MWGVLSGFSCKQDLEFGIQIHGLVINVEFLFVYQMCEYVLGGENARGSEHFSKMSIGRVLLNASTYLSLLNCCIRMAIPFYGEVIHQKGSKCV